MLVCCLEPRRKFSNGAMAHVHRTSAHMSTLMSTLMSTFISTLLSTLVSTHRLTEHCILPGTRARASRVQKGRAVNTRYRLLRLHGWSSACHFPAPTDGGTPLGSATASDICVGAMFRPKCLDGFASSTQSAQH